jgi:hypothetical protein
MKYNLFIFSIAVVVSFSAAAQKGDTIHVRGSDLLMNDLQTGSYSYLIIQQKALDSPASDITIAKMTVARETYHNKPAIVVHQQWDKDSAIHKSYSVFDANDFSTLYHDTYWASLGFSLIFDFETQKFDSKPVWRTLSDKGHAHVEKEFAGALGVYRLNWHADLIVYSLLPYKAGRTFVINYYDPGSGDPQEVPYTVTGSEKLTDRGGMAIDCWVLSHSDDKFTEKFWISKKTNEVLKEEDYGKDFGYRFKYKMGVGVAGWGV